MSRSKALAGAKQLIAEDVHESQDSQAILEALKAELGVGALSGSPVSPRRPRPETGDASCNAGGPAGHAERAERAKSPTNEADEAVEAVVPQGCARLRATVQEKKACPKQLPLDNDATNFTNQSPVARREAAEPSLLRGRQGVPDDAIIVESSLPPGDNTQLSPHGVAERLNTNQQLPTVPLGLGRFQARNMETSQQTLTQVNEDRDYGDFCNAVESSPPIDTLRSPDEPQTLHEDDIGAVNFGNLSPAARPSSQISEDAGFENTRGKWRVPDDTSQQLPGNGYTPHKLPGGLPPETPTLSKNPFGTKQTMDAPFGSSQLFGQTQLPTSAVKVVSPTSSRPSPNHLHNSISPNLLETSPLKNRANVSSPTDIGASSPQRLHNVPATVRRHNISPIQEETPRDSRYPQDDMVPESPTIQPSKAAESRQPLAHYEPMKKSQERKSFGEIAPLALANDSDSDDAVIKQWRGKKEVERRKAQAAKEMGKVTVTLTRRESGEPPFRKRRRVMTNAEEGKVREAKYADPTASNKPNPAARGSQKGLAASLSTPSAGSTKATPGEDASQGDEVTAVRKDADKETPDEEMIPATSPVRSLSVVNSRGLLSASEPELPALVESEPEKGGDDEMKTETSSIPPLRRRRQGLYGRQSHLQRLNRAISSSTTSDAATAELDVKSKGGSAAPSSTTFMAIGNAATREAAEENSHGADIDRAEPDLPKSPPQQSRAEPAALIRPRGRERTPLSPLQPCSAAHRSHASSSLTALSTTPAPSSNSTPGTLASPESDRLTSVSIPSPATGRNLRKRAARHAAKGGSPQQASTRAMKIATRATRVDSESTDELQQSPPSSALEMSIAHSKSSRLFRRSIGPTCRRRLFDGMAFAISMQYDQSKQQKRSTLETKIAQAGGVILQEGFQELFEPPAVMGASGQTNRGEDPLKLVKSSLNCGFTALIADGHSRKVKYMQALALGLPCLAHQWITACLSKGAMVGWEPYLLAAGSCAVLGDAVRSRCLPPYHAADARLADIIEQRPRLLAGRKMLAVVDPKKARSELKSEVKKQQYMFLARALGPSIHRASSTQQAQAALRAHEKAGRPFDWLYMDKSLGTAESVLTPSETTGRKRRRLTAAPAVRVLYDELVIQSLILGRVVGEDEMSF